jgi:hypothetical protein
VVFGGVVRARGVAAQVKTIYSFKIDSVKVEDDF